jgi:NitT/TauT family transport system ATP-binding protein
MENVSLNIEEGEFVCVLGPSGCGKSTLLNLVAGFMSPTSGTLSLDGAEITAPGKERGVVFQEHALFPWMTIGDNILFGLRMKGVDKAAQRQTLEKYLNMVGLTNFKNAFPKQLSGGMKQRTAIARALANEPRIHLMDEPFAALDEQTRKKLQNELVNIWASTGITILFITHSIEEALILADKVVVMTPRPGRIHKIFALSGTARPRNESSGYLAELKQEISGILGMNSEETRGD